jgi:hypothetical protein
MDSHCWTTQGGQGESNFGEYSTTAEVILYTQPFCAVRCRLAHRKHQRTFG